MVKEPLSRTSFRRINELMREEWTRTLKGHFGDEIQIGQWEDLPPGQVWIVEGSTCVAQNTVLEREVVSFTFLSHEYCNNTLDTARFYEINDNLYDELSTLICESPQFDAIKQSLAKELYGDENTDIIPYSMTIWAFLKDARGSRHGLSDGLLHFSVNSSDPDCYQVDGIGHSPRTGHFTYVPRAFLSHTAADKLRLQDILVEFENAGIDAWFDDAELRPGDSLTAKIGSALEHTDTVFVFLSQASVNSRWVQKELNVADALEIKGVRVKVVPVLLDDVRLPPLLADKVYVDLRDARFFMRGCATLLRAAEARFWRMRTPTTHKQALALEKKLPGWHIPDVTQAEMARTCMIYSGLEGFNRPFWTSTWHDRKTVCVLAGSDRRNVAVGQRSVKLDCILVPD